MSTAEFFVLGVTHQRAPLVVRELLAFDEAEVAELHGKMAKLRGLRELVILGTCNRVEFYGVAETPAAIARLEAAFCANRRFAPEAFEALSFELTGAAAVQHLCEVAAGLDSQIVGETEIFGQVKAAFAAGEARRTVGPGLQRIFQKAFQTAKHVRTHTGIGRGSMSAANIAVELARKAFGDLSTARILLLGAGDIGEKTARAFRRSGAATIAVAENSAYDSGRSITWCHIPRPSCLLSNAVANARKLSSTRPSGFAIVSSNSACPNNANAFPRPHAVSSSGECR